MSVELPWNQGVVVIMRDRLETRGTRVYEALTGDHVANLPGWPYVVIEDTDDVVALYLPEGTKLWRWDIVEQRLRMPQVTRGDSVRLMFKDKSYAVDLFFETGSGPAPWVRYLFMGEAPPSYPAPLIPGGSRDAARDARFYGWKVDIVAPFRRTALGFDVADEVLDIVVWPDRGYRWKDEEQMARFVELGIYSAPEADRLREAGREVIDLIEAASPPFDDQWTRWTPPPGVKVPEAPAGWQHLPLGPTEWGGLHGRTLGG